MDEAAGAPADECSWLQGEPRVGFEGRTSINRSGEVLVSDKIEISLETEAFLAVMTGDH